MKIAILILLHEYTEQQKQLIEHLAKDFDIYVHADKRSKIDLDAIQGTNVFVFSEYKVYWGDFSIVLSTIFLLRKAFENEYERYMLISGADIPLKTNSDICNFFKDNKNEYFYNCLLPRIQWKDNGGFDRLDFLYPKLYTRGSYNIFQFYFSRAIRKILRTILIPFLRKLKIHRRRIKDIKYYGGSQWMDLTNNCVSHIISFLDANNWYLKKFKYTNCSDEIFFQTIIFNYVKNVNVVNKCLRYIDWQSGPERPRILRMEDYNKIKQSDKLFARKFNSSVDNEIIKRLYSDINSDS